MKVYKLTTQEGFTKNNTKWGENFTHEVEKLGELCSDNCLHFYFSPFIAILLNPAHANIENPILWEAEAEEPIIRDAFKGGTRKLTTLKQVEPPKYTINQRIYFGILCAKEVEKNQAWNEWADNWISGKDRRRSTAAASYNAYVAAYVATAYAAAYAADAAYAARAAAYAARAAARAAAAAYAAPSINFEYLAKQAYNWEP